MLGSDREDVGVLLKKCRLSQLPKERSAGESRAMRDLAVRLEALVRKGLQNSILTWRSRYVRDLEKERAFGGERADSARSLEISFEYPPWSKSPRANIKTSVLHCNGENRTCVLHRVQVAGRIRIQG